MKEGDFLVLLSNTLQDYIKTEELPSLVDEQLQELKKLNKSEEQNNRSLYGVAAKLASKVRVKERESSGVVIVQAKRVTESIEPSADDAKIAKIINSLDGNKGKIIKLLMGKNPKKKLIEVLKEGGNRPGNVFDGSDLIIDQSLEGFGKTTKDIIVSVVENMKKEEAHALIIKGNRSNGCRWIEYRKNKKLVKRRNK